MSSKKGLSRRQFLMGSTLAGMGAVSFGLAGCNNGDGDSKSNSNGSNGDSAAGSEGAGVDGDIEIFDIESKTLTPERNWSWTKVPDDIPDSEITETIECDVLVIGAGLAGCCAALSAMEEGADTIVIDKIEEGTVSARGLDIAAFHTKLQQELVAKGLMEEPDYRHAIRRWIMWAQGRVKEPLLWQFARKSGACFDWMYDKVIPMGLSCYVWDGYYKGPDYTEYPVTHAFYLTGKEEETFNFTFYGDDDVFGNVVLVPKLYELIEKDGGQIHYSTPCVRLIREGDGRCEGVIAGEEGAYKKYLAKKGVVIASGDYSSNKEMVQCYAPINNYATDKYVYFPPAVNMGEVHQQALWIGAAMQKSEPHACVTHLDFGAASYGFLHVNGEGDRFKNEDVNTQSKSITKALQPTKQAYTIYDSNGLEAVKYQIDNNLGGGLQWGQLTQPIGGEYNLDAQKQVLKDEVAQGMTYESDTIEGLAEQIGCDPERLKASVDRYNELCEQGNDVDFGKRAEILEPIVEPPFYAGHLQACLLTMCGGLRTDLESRVLDVDDNPIEGLYVCGSAQGDFFGTGDYPTFVAGIGHGRCVTFGRIAGINAAGGNAEEEIPSIDI